MEAPPREIRKKIHADYVIDDDPDSYAIRHKWSRRRTDIAYGAAVKINRLEYRAADIHWYLINGYWRWEENPDFVEPSPPSIFEMWDEDEK